MFFIYWPRQITRKDLSIVVISRFNNVLWWYTKLTMTNPGSARVYVMITAVPGTLRVSNDCLADYGYAATVQRARLVCSIQSSRCCSSSSNVPTSVRVLMHPNSQGSSGTFTLLLSRAHMASVIDNPGNSFGLAKLQSFHVDVTVILSRLPCVILASFFKMSRNWGLTWFQMSFVHVSSCSSPCRCGQSRRDQQAQRFPVPEETLGRTCPYLDTVVREVQDLPQDAKM